MSGKVARPPPGLKADGSRPAAVSPGSHRGTNEIGSDHSIELPNQYNEQEVFSVSALVPFRPFGELIDIERQFDRAFRGFLGGSLGSVPSLDVREVDGRLEVIAELPGFKPEDVEITVQEGVLSISARQGQEVKDDRSGYLWRERRSSTLRRQLRLPEGVAAEDVKATLENGLLTVTVPRAQAPAAVRVPIAGAGQAGPTENGEETK
jgi:HSP20 family protein